MQNNLVRERRTARTLLLEGSSISTLGEREERIISSHTKGPILAWTLHQPTTILFSVAIVCFHDINVILF
jgi:hypothetical protein